MDFFNKLWDRPVHMLIVVCVFFSIVTMIINFVKRQTGVKSSEPVRQVAEALRNRNIDDENEGGVDL